MDNTLRIDGVVHESFYNLPGISAMSDAEVKAVKAFIANGGRVIADFLPGEYHDVFIFDTDICPKVSILVLGTDGLLFGRRHSGDNDSTALDMIGVELDTHFGLTAFASRLVHHVNLLLLTHP